MGSYKINCSLVMPGVYSTHNTNKGIIHQKNDEGIYMKPEQNIERYSPGMMSYGNASNQHNSCRWWRGDVAGKANWFPGVSLRHGLLYFLPPHWFIYSLRWLIVSCCIRIVSFTTSLIEITPFNSVSEKTGR